MSEGISKTGQKGKSAMVCGRFGGWQGSFEGGLPAPDEKKNLAIEVETYVRVVW